MIPQALSRAAGDARLKRDEYRVLCKLYEWLDWTEPRMVKLQAIARVTNIHRPNASRAIARLTTFGYLVRGPDDGQIHTYRLSNPPTVSAGATRKAA